jgi:hypothetical protein
MTLTGDQIFVKICRKSQVNLIELILQTFAVLKRDFLIKIQLHYFNLFVVTKFIKNVANLWSKFGICEQIHKKLITLNGLLNSFDHNKRFFLFPFWINRPGLCEFDNINRMITLTGITLSGGHCILKLTLKHFSLSFDYYDGIVGNII